MVETGYWGSRRYEDGADIHGAITEAPSELGIKICDSNVNEDQIYWGTAYDTGEPVIVKDGSVNFGNAAPANIFMSEVFSDTSIEVPEVGYSAEEDQIYIEVLPEYDGSTAAIDEGEKQQLLECIGAKTLMGDSDFMHNIGYRNGNYALIDPDKAGAPAFTVQEDLERYLEAINTGTSFNLEVNEVADAMQRVSQQVKTEELDQIFANLRPLVQQTPAYANFEEEFLRDNFRKASEGRPLT